MLLITREYGPELRGEGVAAAYKSGFNTAKLL